MNQIKNGWFSEINALWPGQSMSLQIKKILLQEKSDYQDILVVETTHHGRALILDGIIQCTEHDEFSYQEMISFIPLCAHPNPTRVLIVGGGDGGVARECHKHPQVEKIVQIEIDAKVIDASKQYLPFMSKGFKSNKLTLSVGDGFKYMKEHKNEFDVIITDSSDPVGPGVNLFTEAYFKQLKEALRSGGIICSQGGTIWTEMEQVKETIRNCRKHFQIVKYAQTSVPTYPSGQIGFVVASDNQDVTEARFKVGEKEIADFKLRYYNSDVHSAAFVLPNFVRKVLYESCQ